MDKFINGLIHINVYFRFAFISRDAVQFVTFKDLLYLYLFFYYVKALNFHRVINYPG